MPRTLPTISAVQANSVKRRAAEIHSSPSRPVASAATTNANGTAQPTMPRYSIGGWIIIQ
jgi:hypothetical protein